MWRCWLLILLFLGTGCVKTGTEQSTEASSATDSSALGIASSDEITTITADRLGPARLGATFGELKAEVNRVFGNAITFASVPNFMVDLDAIAVTLGDETLFYVLQFSSEPLSDDDPVRLLLTTNPRFKTTAGVGPGTRLPQAEAVYGEATLAYSAENETRESVQFSRFEPVSVVFRTNGFADGEAAALAGLYAEPMEGSFYKTTQYRSDAVIQAVMLDGQRLEASRRSAGDGATDAASSDAAGEAASEPPSASASEDAPADNPTPSEKADRISYAEADRQLNRTYRTVTNALSPDAQAELVAAQRSWISFRDAECAFQPLLGVDQEDCLAELTGDRTAQLNLLLTDEALIVSDSLLAGLGTVDVVSSGGEIVNCDDPQDTSSVSYCTFLAYEREDARLNKVYQAIQSGPSDPVKESLVDAQLAWIDFRDAHCLSEVQEAYGATGYNAYYAACQARITQQRTSRLSGYSDLL